ncbi:MAG: hypothetical protein ABS81_05990 [Pseudonocardia sp. SCN 72-86]|nr:MAG: hypothetical protein ABS81_05990 [Pseudonocardia sp. SCN 72-86]
MLQDIDERSILRRYDEFYDEVEWADGQGFESIWITEHHFSNYSVSSSPLIMLAKAAERARTVRIGTAVLVLPLWDPVRLVADVSTLDVLTGGRVDLGIGRGYQPHESWGFGQDPAKGREVFEEAVELILQLFDHSDTTFHGKHFDVPVPVTIVPRPLQTPRPPMWMAASSPPSIRFAAQHGFHFMAPTTWTAAELAVRRDFIAECIAEAGGSPEGREFQANRFVFCGTDEDEIQTAIRASALQATVSKAMLHGNTPVNGINPPDYGTLTIEAAVRERFLIGSPDEIVAQLESLGEAGITYVQGLFRYGDLPAELGRRSLERFAAEVLPRLTSVTSTPLVLPEHAEVAR